MMLTMIQIKNKPTTPPMMHAIINPIVFRLIFNVFDDEPAYPLPYREVPQAAFF